MIVSWTVPISRPLLNNMYLDAVGASRATVGAGDGLGGLGDGGILAGAESWDTGKVGAAVLVARV